MFKQSLFLNLFFIFLLLQVNVIAKTDLDQEVLDKIFTDRHLDSIKKKSSLVYFFQGYDEAGDFFKDKITMSISDINDKNLKTINFKIFSGKRERKFPKLSHRYQNPVMVIFLQRDAENTAKILGENSQKIRSLIKNAFRNNITSERISIKFNRQKLNCIRGSIQPFSKQPMEVFRDFITKKYIFTLCPKIPGKLYQIETDVKNDKDVSLFIERIRFDKMVKE